MNITAPIRIICKGFYAQKREGMGLNRNVAEIPKAIHAQPHPGMLGNHRDSGAEELAVIALCEMMQLV